MKAIELFVGAGGLGIGTALAGFKHEAVIEWSRTACDTIRYNQERKVAPVTDWHLIESDVRAIRFQDFGQGIDLVAGGPPCQPFSIGGKHKGYHDERDMFPEAVRAVRELQPKAFLFENVRGLARQSFAKYFEYILLQLNYPELTRCQEEDWLHHLNRLEEFHTGGSEKGLHYHIVFRVLNAADYGVPQKRERVIIVGFRSDLSVNWSFPEPTHSREALLWHQWQTGEYWEKHKVAKKNRPTQPFDHVRASKLNPPIKFSWRTIRDAFDGLPNPTDKNAGKIPNHRFQPGARVYKGHTGSPLDEPAKTLKAGDHGVPGGENMLLLPNGDVRYFTVRESARLQTFPDNYQFNGAWTEAMRQIGNAVPVKLAEIVAKSVLNRLREVDNHG